MQLRYVFLTLLFLIASQTNAQPDAKIKVALLSEKEYRPMNMEINSALDFLKHYENTIHSDYITFEDIQDDPGMLKNYDLVWFHRQDTSDFSELALRRDILGSIKNYVAQGGNLLLSLDAFRYIIPLGIETVPPESRTKAAEDKGYGRKLGLHAFREHPVFDGMFGGAYIYKPIIDLEVRQTGYFGDQLPAEGKIVAVDWDYIFLREENRLLVEYDVGEGKVLAIGAYTHFAAPNLNRKHLDRFMLNSINYLAGKMPDKKAYYWDFSTPAVHAFSTASEKLDYKSATPWKNDTMSLVLSRPTATDNYWDVAGHRALIMGNEKGGIDEIWTHPFMALRDYEVGIKFSYRDSIYWLNDRNPRIEKRPGSFKRIYKFRRAYFTEIITTQIDKPTALIHYEYRGVYPAEIYIRWKSNFRIMWPYNHKALGNIYYAMDSLNNRSILRDASGDFVLIAGAGKKPEEFHLGQYAFKHFQADSLKVEETDDYQIASLMKFKLEMNEDFNFYVAASGEGLDKTKEYYTDLINSPEKTYRATEKYYKKLLDENLQITTPNAEFNEGYAWALAATDQFYVNTPGIGKSLVAGYATSAKGWDGGDEVSGRPGYAWYFGRDAVWSAFAVLGYGDFEKVREILKTFQKFQDLNGKIYHEQSTSGFVHYDASDATPLYIILAGKYLKQSGDIAFIRESWPYLKKAIDFCISTDTDGDHLIENTNVGHGWVEGGSLFGSHTSLYLAALWAETLEESAYMAGALKKQDLAENYTYEASIVREMINSDYWNEEKDFFYHGKFQDGTYHREPTIMPAIPMLFGQIEEKKAKPVLDEFAGNNFSSNWGTRIVRKESELYNPHGYHTGSVWPLYTGWTALAEYEYGNSLQGFTHVMNNLKIYKYWGLGYLEEVMNGAEYKPSGVCAHQCWSQTMVLQPIVDGLIGYKPDAVNNKVILRPAFPADWDSIKIKNLKFGNNRISLEMERSQGKTKYIIQPEFKNPFELKFDPVFPEVTRITSFSVNGKKTQSAEIQHEFTKLNLSWEVSGKTVIVVNHKGGISALPYVPNPNPGNDSDGFRIIDTDYMAGKYIVEVEGVPGNVYELKVCSATEPESVEGASLIATEGDISTLKVVFKPSEDEFGFKEIKFVTE